MSVFPTQSQLLRCPLADAYALGGAPGIGRAPWVGGGGPS